MNIYIKLTIAGTDVGPFDLYSNTTSFTIPFETGIARESLVNGYTTTLAPTGTTQIKIQSTGVCTSSTIISVAAITTTTTSTTSHSTTTTTTSVASSTTTSTTIGGGTSTTTTTTTAVYYHVQDCYGNFNATIDKEGTDYNFYDMVRYKSIPSDGNTYCGYIDDANADGPATGTLYGSIPSGCEDGCHGEP